MRLKLDGLDDVTVKFAALPDELATIASREPLASVTTFAVTPRPAVLIALARSLSVFTPLLPTVMVSEPLAVVIVNDSPEGSAVVLLATVVDDQLSVVARLPTITTLSPGVVPGAVVPVTMLEFDEVTLVADNGPEKLLKACMSLSRFVASVWS